jgi:hypothetical protein
VLASRRRERGADRLSRRTSREAEKRDEAVGERGGGSKGESGR